MISDSERREVAARLREPKESLLAYADDELIRLRREVRCAPGQDLYERLADLIDRPTCRNVSGYQDTFKCSECGYKTGLIAEVCNEHGESFHMPLMPSRCPNCVAEVAE